MRGIRATAVYEYDNFNGILNHEQKTSIINTIFDSTMRNKKIIIFESLINPETEERTKVSSFVDFEQTNQNIKKYFGYNVTFFDKDEDFNIELVSAYYGIDGYDKVNMTQSLKEYLGDAELKFLMCKEICRDPIYGMEKFCYLKLNINNKIVILEFNEYEKIDFSKDSFPSKLFENTVVESCDKYKYPGIFFDRMEKCVVFKFL